MLRLATLLLLLYWLALFLGTHLPSSALPSFEWSDKVLHLGAFAGLTFLLCWSVPNRSGKRLNNVMIAGVLASAYGSIDELTQKFIPGRHCDIWDLIADVIGVGIGCCAYLVAKRLLTYLRDSQGTRLRPNAKLQLQATKLR